MGRRALCQLLLTIAWQFVHRDSCRMVLMYPIKDVEEEDIKALLFSPHSHYEVEMSCWQLKVSVNESGR